MIKDLVERLRTEPTWRSGAVMQEAADMIEQQFVMITRLISQNEGQRVLIAEHIHAQREAEKRLEELENFIRKIPL